MMVADPGGVEPDPDSIPPRKNPDQDPNLKKNPDSNPTLDDQKACNGKNTLCSISFFIGNIYVVVYHVTIVASGHG